MSRRDGTPDLLGPLVAQDTDIDEINRVFSEAFTERYHRDGMTGVRVPLLNPIVWRYAIAAAGDGAFVWRTMDGGVAAFNLVHISGGEGWMGPLAVRPDHQGRGLGRRIVSAGIAQLKAQGCKVIGLETMPRTIDNIGFYTSLGFRPGPLTISLAKEVSPRAGASPSSRDAGGNGKLIDECRQLSTRVLPIADFGREMELTFSSRLGDVTVVRRGGSPVGFALWHTVPLAVGRNSEEVRVLKLAAIDLPALRDLTAELVAQASQRGFRKVTIRCQTGYRNAFRELVALGFRVHWTDLRMLLDGYDEPSAEPGVMFSNWEI